MSFCRTRLVFAFLLFDCLFAERLTLSFDTGGRGLLPVLDLATIAVVFGLVIVFEWNSLRFLVSSEFLTFWMPYLFLSALLPVLGVLFMGYSGRTLLSVIKPTLAFSFITAGFWSAARSLRLTKSLLFWSIVFQAMYGIVLFLQKSGILHLNVLDAVVQWDYDSQTRSSEQYLVAGRAIGFFLNPNDFSFWAALAFWAALSFLRGPRRLIAAGASLASLALGQSRGSLASWILTLVLWPIAQSLRRRNSANTAKLLR